MNDQLRDLEDSETNGYAKIDRYDAAGVERMSGHVRGDRTLAKNAARGARKETERVATALQFSRTLCDGPAA